MVLYIIKACKINRSTLHESAQVNKVRLAQSRRAVVITDIAGSRFESLSGHHDDDMTRQQAS
jgi:hypothetical protein